MSSSITLKDMFCGCGGSSTGASAVEGVHVKYAMNHWKLAIESHNSNHPETHHDCADISETHPARYDRTTGLIGSPECTNHSLAKGQRRKNLGQGELFTNKAIDHSAIRSRATMWDIVRFAEVHKYEFVITENVVDVKHWVLFDAWLKAMHTLGYNHRCVYLNAMFAHGEGINGFAPQSRDRIYVVFWKKGNKAPNLEIRPKAPCPNCGEVESYQAWKPRRNSGKYKAQYTYRCSVCNENVVPYYYAALNCINPKIPLVKIGDREKPLSEKTMQRIQFGLDKFGLRPTIVDLCNQHGAITNRIRQADDSALNTQTTRISSYLFSPFIFNMSHTNSTGTFLQADKDTLFTQTTQESAAIVVPSEIITLRGSLNFSALTEPLPTQVAAAIQNCLVSQKSFITTYHGKPQAALLTEPLYTVVTKDSHSLITGSDKPKIEDCYFRMLQPEETAAAQGFPKDYVILGSKENKQKQIGNANPPPTMQLLVKRCVESLS